MLNFTITPNSHAPGLKLFGIIMLVCAQSSHVAAKDVDFNLKAPPPLKEKAPHRYVPKEICPVVLPGEPPVKIDPQSNVNDLPYLKIVGYDLKIAFTPMALEAFGLKSGESVPAEVLYAVIAAERELEKSKLR